MIVALLVAGALTAVFLARRRRSRRADVRAGIVADRPQFFVTPPVVSLIRKEDHRW